MGSESLSAPCVAPPSAAGTPVAVFAQKSVLLVSVGLAAATFFLFWPACANSFVNYDDQLYVTENAHVQQGLSLSTAAWSLRALDGGNWHPLTWLSLLLDARLYGPTAPWGYHFTNVLLHTANVVLLFLVLWRMTGALACSALVAALFGVHPLHVESVAWISERKDVLSTFFWLVGMGGYALYAEKPTPGRYALVAAALALGLMSKPMLVTFPCVLLLLDYWPLGRVRLGWRRLVAEKIPFFLLSILVCGVTWYAQRTSQATASLRDIPLAERTANALVAYGTYVFKTFWPANLTILYPLRFGQVDVLAAAASAALLVAVSLAVVIVRRRCPYLLVGWFWYMGTLVPVIGLVQVGMQSMADRYTYVPLIGLFVMLAWGGADVARRWRCEHAAFAAASVLLMLCMVVSWRQIGFWRNSVTLWTHALAVDENNPLAHLQLADALWSIATSRSAAGEPAEKEFDDALAHYRRCVDIDLSVGRRHFYLGDALLKRGQVDRAVPELETAVRLQPTDADPWCRLGLAYARQGRYDAAEKVLRNLTSQRSEMDDAWEALARVLSRERKWADAAACFHQALAAGHKDEAALLCRHVGLAWSLEYSGRPSEAHAEYMAAARLDSEWATTLADQAWSMATDADPARRNGFMAVALAEPAAAKARLVRRARNLDILAAAYAEDGDWQQAVTTAEQAERVAKTSREAELAAQIALRHARYQSLEPYRAPPKQP